METKSDPKAMLDAIAPTQNALVAAPQFLPPARPVGAQKVAVYRDEERVFQKLAALAARAGDDWFYRFPVKNRKAGTSSFVEGPSIKLANDLVRIYGNCEVAVEVRDVGTHWLFNATLIDFETGYVANRWFQQRKAQGSIGGDVDRQMDIAFQIGQSKAIRNVVVNALQTFADFAFEEARSNLVAKVGQNIDKFRAKVLERLAELNVAPGRAAAVVGRSPSDWLAPDIAQLISMIKAIADGMATVDETFPPIEDEKKPAEEDGSLSQRAAAKASDKKIHAARTAGRLAGLEGQPENAMAKTYSDHPALKEAWLDAHATALAERREQMAADARDIDDVMGTDDDSTDGDDWPDEDASEE